MKGKSEIIQRIKENEFVSNFLVDYGIQLKKIVIVGVLIIMAFFALGLKNNNNAEILDEDNTEETSAVQENISQAEKIYVDIGGEVNTPMLAELPIESRVDDAIVAAGGVTADADLTNVNRAEFLTDGEKIYIPKKSKELANTTNDDTALTDGISTVSNSKYNGQGSKVNINTADSAALQTLNGVGPATAQKIIDYRNANGRFTSLEDIKNVSGIGDKTFEKLKDYITI